MPIRDVFYYGAKPNVHPREQFAESLTDARHKCSTEHFWIINEFCDYKNFDWDFDFEFLPDEDVWAENHNNVWPSQHQKDSGTWLCPKEHSEIIIYRNDVFPIYRKNEKYDNWVELDLIDHNKFDFSWHPDPTDPPYIYKWGCKFFPAVIKHVLEYHVPGATQEKYMNTVVELLPRHKLWVEHQAIDKNKFDLSWRPDPREPAYIYVFGNELYDSIKMPTLEYHCEGATEYKYMGNPVAKLANNSKLFDHLENSYLEDYAWLPDPDSPPYIYAWGNQWNAPEDKISVQFVVPGATTYKFMEKRAIRKPCMDNWIIPDDVDTTGFDFSWEPNPAAPPYIYEFATQWQKTGGPKYIVPGATEKQYVDFQKATKLSSNKENWSIPDNIDTSSFDFSWHPDATSPPYIYIFATQWAFSGGPIYTVSGATEIKYVDDQIAKAMPNKNNWVYDSKIEVESFDFSWHPNIEDKPYIYQFGTQHQKTGGPRYITPGADSSSPVKYIDTRIIKATRLPDCLNPCWKTIHDVVDFDWSWHPDDTDEPYIYVFGNQWYPAEVMPTIEYVVPGATEKKYVHSIVATLASNMDNWMIPDDIEISSFDFSWRPEPESPPYIYEFATQWQKTGGPKYIMPNASEKKYIDYQKAIRLPQNENWTVPENVDRSEFDFSWHPDATSPPYIYVFATQWAFSGGPVYSTPDATEIKYVDDQIAKAMPNKNNWVYDSTEIDIDSFDFSWHPNIEDKPYIYQFGTQHQKTGGPRYITPGADSSSPVKYIDTRIIKATRLPNRSRFTVLGGAKVRDFDWSWHPDDTSPPYIYQFGNNWYPAEEMPTVEYRVEQATEAKFINEVVAQLAFNMDNWKIPVGIDVTKFDFSWIPHPTAKPYIYQFGTSTDPSDGPIYISPGNDGETINVPRVEVNEVVNEPEPMIDQFVEEPLISNELLDVFFVDKGNIEAAARFEQLKSKFGTKIQKTRYLNSWVDTINRCSNRATSQLFWVLNSELDYSDFDFTYYPNLWQMKMVHVFGTQWSHWGTTFLVNRETFSEDTKYIKIIEHLSNLNFVKTIKARATQCVHDIIMIDHGNSELFGISEQVEKKAARKLLATVQYDTSYLNTLKSFIKLLPDRKEHYLWVCSSICDYSTFDFSYVCDPFAKDNLHVFPSGKQKFGDTFLLDVNKTKEIINDIESLELYTTVNYNRTLTADRLPAPQIVTTDDTLVDTVKTSLSHSFPYSIIMTEDNMNLPVNDYEPMNLWELKTKNIISTSTGNSRIVVPKEAAGYVTRELYEYPYIKRAAKLTLSNPLDIVFLSNGEKGADENYEHLLEVTRNLPNRVVRVDGINGRVAAYHAAAEASNTAWMFTVFAKLKVSNKFDWNWQPDRMQVPKHYIFHAKNPVNGLIYGHQAMIAYNKKLTLANQGLGLDFTLDDEHEVVPLISGTAHYNTDEFSTWRTAFREVIKLKADTTDIAKDRLDAWLNKATGDFSQYSIKGALDADEYYTEVDGDFSAIKLSYEWDWLIKKFSEV